MRRFPAAFLLLAFASACSAGGGGSVDGGSRDGIVEVSLDVPPGCPPDAGNAKGIGTPCTPNGGQCKGDLHCSCDSALGTLLVGVPCFCSIFQLAQNGSKAPCTDSVTADYCGAGATCCNYLTTLAYCVPSICLPDNQCLVFDADAGM
jgi:hypothetical protein